MLLLCIITYSCEELVFLTDIAVIFFQKFAEQQLRSHIPNVC